MPSQADVVSVSEFKDHLQEHLDQCKVTSRPLFVGSNGETEAVVLSPAAYKEIHEHLQLAKSLELLDRAMEDVKAGRVTPVESARRRALAEIRQQPPR